MKNDISTTTLGNGCFWCTEAIFRRVNGVISVTSGYSGGQMPNPDYKSVCSGDTGHAECLQILFDPSVISFEQLLEIFWLTHDPTTLNRQGNDIGTQYRSVVFYHDEWQRQAAETYMQKLNASGRYSSPIVTTLEKFSTFYPAEAYHQEYFEHNGMQPYCHLSIRPKVEKFKKEFQHMLKPE
jgi:peptide-methionine (S)-S-oxide reductase